MTELVDLIQATGLLILMMVGGTIMIAAALRGGEMFDRWAARSVRRGRVATAVELVVGTITFGVLLVIFYDFALEAVK